MYVAMAAVQLGVAILLNNLWIFLMLIPAILATSVIIAKGGALPRRTTGDRIHALQGVCSTLAVNATALRPHSTFPETVSDESCGRV